jgi:hypothetical protein
MWSSIVAEFNNDRIVIDDEAMRNDRQYSDILKYLNSYFEKHDLTERSALQRLQKLESIAEKLKEFKDGDIGKNATSLLKIVYKQCYSVVMSCITKHSRTTSNSEVTEQTRSQNLLKTAASYLFKEFYIDPSSCDSNLKFRMSVLLLQLGDNWSSKLLILADSSESKNSSSHSDICKELQNVLLPKTFLNYYDSLPTNISFIPCTTFEQRLQSLLKNLVSVHQANSSEPLTAEKYLKKFMMLIQHCETPYSCTNDGDPAGTNDKLNDKPTEKPIVEVRKTRSSTKSIVKESVVAAVASAEASHIVQTQQFQV